MAIGEIFLAAFLQVLFDKLASSGISLFVKGQRGIPPKFMEEWQRKLKLIGAYLSDAEQKQSNSEAVKLWLQDLQDLAYDLEDILDDFLTNAQLTKMIKLGDHHGGPHFGISCSTFIKVPSFLTHASKKANYSARIKQISRRLKDILTQTKSLCLSEQMHLKEEWAQDRIGTSSLVCGPVVFGRDDDTKEIIRRLMNDESSFENYMVIALVGQGGIGKTTLAQHVYNDSQVKDYFDIRAWVTMSSVFDVKRITNAIINSVTPDKPVNFNDINNAQEQLQNLLADKIFLIVLDDVWNDEYGLWDQLQTPFQSAAKGSRVMTTTRIDKAAKNMIRSSTQCPIFYVKGLSNDNCWLLFRQHAPVDNDLLGMQDEVLPLFKGLPLAAKALGGLLRKEDKSKWPRILQSKMWSEEGVLPALKLSYHHLPPHLKRIFAYCSIFPKNYVFNQKDVVLMWMAEGLIPKDKEGRMEETGGDYFLDLVSRSLFEPHPYRRRIYIMHDLIHDLAQWAAGDICCTTGIKSVSSRTRHFSFTFDVGDDSLGLLPTTPDNVGQLRTFAVFAKAYDFPPIELPDLSTSQFKYLRLLSLARMRIIKLPSIGNLRHLRLLDLSCTDIRQLPGSTRNLCNLQTLLLRNCRFLEALDVTFLTELQYLDVDGTASLDIPMGIGKLTKLRTLNGFVLKTKNGCMLRELKNLNDLQGSLKISGLQNVVSSEDAQEARIHEKSGVEALRMVWGTSTSEIDDNIESNVLQHFQPHKTIKHLLLEGYRALKFPAWLGNPSFTKMVVIKLIKCVRCKYLPPLGKLPTLKEVWAIDLHSIETIGPEFYGAGCSNPFPSLKVLHFRGMKSWKEWKLSSVEKNFLFPCLEELSIINCKVLEECYPRHLPTLQILHIKNCYKLKVSLPSCPQLRKLMIIGCKELFSTNPIICCTESIRLVDISEFSGLEGFQVKGFQKLVLGAYEYLEREQSSKLIEITRCPNLHNWLVDGYTGSDSKLKEVQLENCEDLIPFLQENKLLSTVRELFIKSFYSLKSAATLTGLCTHLEVLSIGHCSSLLTIDQLPVMLRTLDINDCRKLQSIDYESCSSIDGGKLYLLEEVNIESCKSLTSLFSKSLFETTREVRQNLPCKFATLTRLRVSECPFAALFPQGLILPRIKELSLTHCTEFEVIPSEISKLTSLTKLDFVDVKITQPAQEWGLDLLIALQLLELGSLGSSVDSVECICSPDLYLPSSLSRLSIKGFQNLKSILCSSLPNLTALSVHSCPRFESLVDNDLPSKLRHVEIRDCPLTGEQCQSDRGGSMHTGFADNDMYDGGYLSSDSFTSSY